MNGIIMAAFADELEKIAEDKKKKDDFSMSRAMGRGLAHGTVGGVAAGAGGAGLGYGVTRHPYGAALGGITGSGIGGLAGDAHGSMTSARNQAKEKGVKMKGNSWRAAGRGLLHGTAGSIAGALTGSPAAAQWAGRLGQVHGTAMSARNQYREAMESRKKGKRG